jgi:glycosyltransferase involved in cell wall biosynthesis
MSELSYPRISVITPVRNGMPYLQGLLSSVQCQDYPFVEHIVIDDGSDDGGKTRKVLEGAMNVRWWSRQNLGQYPTQNEGLMAATGDLVTFICSDDVYINPRVLSKVAAAWHPGIHVLYGDTINIGEDGKELPYQLEHKGPIEPSDLLTVCLLQHCSVFLERRFLLERHLLFDESFRVSGDWEWLIRVFAAARDDMLYVPAALSAYRHWVGQTTRQPWYHEVAVAEQRRIYAMYGGSMAAYCAVMHARLWPDRWKKARGLWKAGGLPMLTRALAGRRR